MDRAEIEAALDELGAALARRRVDAKLWLVGGAVMVLAFHARESTDDVDGAAYPSGDVFALARAIGTRRGLGAEWLNDRALAYFPHATDGTWMPVRHYGGLEILAADKRMMLAMKLRASRGQRDMGDIHFLLEACGVRSESAAFEIYSEFFTEDPLPMVGRVILREWFEARADALGPDDRAAAVGVPARAPGATHAVPAVSNGLSPSTEVWVTSTRGRLSHRVRHQMGDDVTTMCRQHFVVSNCRVSRSPKKSPCRRCDTRSTTGK